MLWYFNRIILIFWNWGKKGQSCLHLKDLVVVRCFIFADLQLQLKRNTFFFIIFFSFFFMSFSWISEASTVSWTVMSKLPTLCFDRFLSASYTQCHAFKSWVFFFNQTCPDMFENQTRLVRMLHYSIIWHSEMQRIE